MSTFVIISSQSIVKLNDAQKTELAEWRAANPDAHKRTKDEDSKSTKVCFAKKQVSLIVLQQIRDELDKLTKEDAKESELESKISAVVTKLLERPTVGSTTVAATPATESKVSLRSILKAAKNYKS